MLFKQTNPFSYYWYASTKVKIHPRPQRADAGSGKRRRLALLMNESNTVVKAKITTKRYRLLDT